MKVKKPGWVWVPRKDQFQPFNEFREIRRGNNKGRIEVTLPAKPPRKVVVEKKAIRSLPTYEIGEGVS